MKPFDQRWRTLAQQARLIPDEIPAEVPVGFTTRVMARTGEASVEPWSDLLSVFSLRAAAAVTCLLFVSAGYAFAEWYDFRIEPPALESAITSELPWP